MQVIDTTTKPGAGIATVWLADLAPGDVFKWADGPDRGTISQLVHRRRGIDKVAWGVRALGEPEAYTTGLNSRVVRCHAVVTVTDGPRDYT